MTMQKWLFPAMTTCLFALGCGGMASDGGSAGGSAGAAGGGAGAGGGAAGGTIGGAGGAGRGAGGTPGTSNTGYPEGAPALAKYVVTGLVLPSGGSSARDLGCDLDGDGDADNALGQILGTVAGQAGANPQTFVDQAFQQGLVTILAEAVSRTNLSDAPSGQAGMRAGVGSRNGNTLRLDGPSAKLAGAIAGGVGNFGPADLTIAVPLGAAPLELTLLAAQARDVRLSAAGIQSGKMCGAISEAELNAKVLPEFAKLLNQALATGGNGATTLCSLFDTDRSCAASADACAMFSAAAPPPAGCISAAEVTDNAVVRQVVRPDVTVGGQRALSLGVGFAATSAMF